MAGRVAVWDEKAMVNARASALERTEALFAEWQGSNSPGCAVGVYIEGQPVLLRGYGMADLEHGIAISPGTVFHIASLSKQFTAAAILLLARDGGLTLEDSIRKHIPELPQAVDVTLRQILHHTSGLRDQWDLLRLAGWRHADLKTTDDILRLATRQAALNFAPGSRFQYINTGYTLLGVAIQRLTGTSLREFTTKVIFEPLGMSQTWFNDDHSEIVRQRAMAYSPDSAGRRKINVPAYETVGPTGLLSTIDDFARWERNFVSPSTWDEDFVQQMLTPPEASSYAYGLIIGAYRGLKTAEHAGGDAGFRAYFLRFPEVRFAVAIFCNCSDFKPGELARRVADIFLEVRFPVTEAWSDEIPAWAGRGAGVAPISPAELQKCTGVYRDSTSGMSCRIEQRGMSLVLIGTGGAEYELVPAGPRHFRFKEIDAECLFGEASRALVVNYAGTEAAACELVEEAQETPAPDTPPAAYAGEYWSDELELLYNVQTRGDDMWLRRPRFPEERLNRLAGDKFSTSREGFHVMFARDAAGRVNGLSITTERVWNARFERIH